MKAVVRKNGKTVLTDVPTPRPDAGEVLVQVTHTTICRTDLYAATGRIPTKEGRILGHEFSGVIEEIGQLSEGSNLESGMRIAVNPASPCRSCEPCSSGLTHRCGNPRFLGLDRDGSFAERIVVPAEAVHALPSNVPLELAAYAEPIAAAQAVLEVGISKGSRVLIFGAGRIADLTRDVLIDDGFASVTVQDRGSAPGGKFDAIIEAGIEGRDIERLLDHLKTGGLFVLKSRTPSNVEFPLWRCVRKQVVMKGAHYGAFHTAISYLERNGSAIRPYLGQTFPLEEFAEAFRAAEDSEAKKITLIPSS